MVYHAIPAYLAANKQRARAFQRAWNQFVSAGDVLYANDPRARAVIGLQRGEDPFDVTTQMRSVWK
jgi:hypothetical protein